MAKQFFTLPGYYEGITVRRLKHSGRLWLARVISDEDKRGEDQWKFDKFFRQHKNWRPYWFVIIKNFDLKKDAACGAKTIGSWRFQWEEDALAKFDELKPFFPEQKFLPTPKQTEWRKVFAEKNRLRKKEKNILPAHE